jgi:NitT/TauT family transport system ATP-binding protein
LCSRLNLDARASVFDNVFAAAIAGFRAERRKPAVNEALAPLTSSSGRAFPRELGRMRAPPSRALVLRQVYDGRAFAALDEITRFKLNDDLLRLQRELGTFIAVTHSAFESLSSTRIG